jgi:hypothetical protein
VYFWNILIRPVISSCLRQEKYDIYFSFRLKKYFEDASSPSRGRKKEVAAEEGAIQPFTATFRWHLKNKCLGSPR